MWTVEDGWWVVRCVEVGHTSTRLQMYRGRLLPPHTASVSVSRHCMTLLTSTDQHHQVETRTQWDSSAGIIWLQILITASSRSVSPQQWGQQSAPARAGWWPPASSSSSSPSSTPQARRSSSHGGSGSATTAPWVRDWDSEKLSS